MGINGFWVLFSIILGAGLFGFAGMLLGVPVFVVIYTFFANLVSRKLARSGLPTETADYLGLGYFDPRTGRPMDWEGHPSRGRGRKKVKKTPAEPENGSAENPAAAGTEKPNGGEPKS